VAILPAGSLGLPAVMTPADFAERPVVLHQPGASTRRIVDGWFLRAGMPKKPVMELGNVEAIKKIVSAGLGCSILPRMAVAEREERPQLDVRPLEPRLDYRLGVALRNDKPLDRGLREVMTTLTALGRPRGG